VLRQVSGDLNTDQVSGDHKLARSRLLLGFRRSAHLDSTCASWTSGRKASSTLRPLTPSPATWGWAATSEGAMQHPVLQMSAP
jgi:hypothetical protein